MDKVTAVFQYSGIKKITTHNKMNKQKTFNTDILDILVIILRTRNFEIMQVLDTLFNSFQLKTKICISYPGILVSHIMI